MRTALRGTWFVTAQAWRAAPASLATGWVLQFALALVPGVQVLILAALIERLDGTAQLGDVLGLVLLVVGILGLVGPLRGVADLMRSQAEDAGAAALSGAVAQRAAHAVELMKLLVALVAERGLKIVVVLHDLNVAARFADTVVAMRDGRVVAHGPVDQVLSAEQLGELYETEVAVAEVAGRRVVLWG